MGQALSDRAAHEAVCLRRTRLPDVFSVEVRSRRAYPRHTHDEFGIGVILDGAQDSASGRGPVRAGAGQIITVNPNEVHDGIPLDAAARHWRMLYFKPQVLASTFAGLDLPEGSELAHPVLDHPAARHAFLSLHHAITEHDGSDLAIEGLLLETLSHLTESDAARIAAAPAAIAPAQRLIDADPASSHSLEALARHASLSRFHFLRSFRAATGLPPHAYQLQRRLQLARRLILEGTPIAETALAAGFSDQAHLSRHFLRVYGYTCGNIAKARGVQP